MAAARTSGAAAARVRLVNGGLRASRTHDRRDFDVETAFFIVRHIAGGGSAALRVGSHRLAAQPVIKNAARAGGRQLKYNLGTGYWLIVLIAHFNHRGSGRLGADLIYGAFALHDHDLQSGG